jgi:putative ATP-dependent endonuclease of OLD family
MILTQITIRNYRSIVDIGDIPLTRVFAFIGENNSGKSNLIRAIECLMSAGSGGVSSTDFNDPAQPILIKGVFDTLSGQEKKRWRPYLVNNQLILEKHLDLKVDERTGKEKTDAEFHGYKAEPADWFLSIPKIEERAQGARVNWKTIVESNHLPDYFLEDSKCTKPIFQKGLARYLEERDVAYDEPDVSSTQALGFPSNVVATLPSFYLLKAITDYTDEIDKRSTSSTFRRLMGDLGDRIIKKDPRYQEIQTALDTIHSLFNKSIDGTQGTRLHSLSQVEARFTELLKKLMPAVEKVSMSIEVEDAKDIFSGGVALTVDDGVDTTVLAKGNGLQRCIVFTLLQTLILNERNQLLAAPEQLTDGNRTILLAIEEPELYIHPQLSKLFFDVMREFGRTDQVIYSSHSPLFIDAFDYDRIAIVTKTKATEGTKVRTCDPKAFDGLNDRKLFQGLTRLNPSVSELFFARRVLLVEGPEDQIAITATLQKEAAIVNRIEELDWSIIVTGGKQCIPFFQRVLNGFSIPYSVLHDHDITDSMNANDKATHENTNNEIVALANGNPVHKFPIKLEMMIGLDHHFKDQFEAHNYFQEIANIPNALSELVNLALGIVINV